MIETPSPIHRRGWATSSLIAGLLWILLAILPIPLTTPLGLPFAGYAIVVGAVSLRHSLRMRDSAGAWRAGWGAGLGCAGFVYLLITYLILGTILVGGLVAFFNGVNHGTPMPPMP